MKVLDVHGYIAAQWLSRYRVGPRCALVAGSLSGSAGVVEWVNFSEAVDCLCHSVGAGVEIPCR